MGHGYLNDMGKVYTPTFIYCPKDNDVHHTYLACNPFTTNRFALAEAIGGFAQETIMETMLES